MLGGQTSRLRLRTQVFLQKPAAQPGLWPRIPSQVSLTFAIPSCTRRGSPAPAAPPGTPRARDVTPRAVRRASCQRRPLFSGSGWLCRGRAGPAPLSKCRPLLKAGRGGQSPALSPLRSSGASHHEQTEGAAGDAQRGNHRHAHRLAPGRAPLAFFSFLPTSLPSPASHPSLQPCGWGRPAAAGSLPCGSSFGAHCWRLNVSPAGDSCVTIWAVFGLARVQAGVHCLLQRC